MKSSMILKQLLQTTIFVIIMAAATTSWAKLPPPPVNQNLGMPDVRHTSPMTFYTCLSCHEEGRLPYRHHLRTNTPIDEYSASPFFEASTDGTHQCITCHESDWIEDSSKPQGGYFKFIKEPTELEFRNCMNCHKQSISSRGKLTATVHHLTDKAQKKLCFQCHGSAVNNATDDHRIPDPTANKSRNCQKLNLDIVDPTAIDPNNPTPTESNNYNISLITPWPGDNYDDIAWKGVLRDFYSECPEVAEVYLEEGGQFQINPPSYRYEMDAAGDITAILVPDNLTGGRRTGNCEHCHFAGENPGDAVQPNTGLAQSIISTNMANHHNTGVGQPGTGSVHSCNLCHSPRDPPDYAIRGCEICHAISTLHSIEYDVEGDGITPGLEKPFMGHIGSDLNCRGCHLNFRTGVALQESNNRTFRAQNNDSEISVFGGLPGYNTPIPDIESLSTVAAIAGTETALIITGTGFYAAINTPFGIKDAIPHVEMIDSKGIITEFTLERSDVTETTINVTIPATMKPDIYELYIVKGQRYTQDKEGRDYSQQTGAIPFLITPNVTIDSVNCSSGTVTIHGSGFGNMTTADRYGREGYIDTQGKVGVSHGESGCTIQSWEDKKIIAQCNEGTDNITINSIYGKASSDTECGGGRPDWWSLWSWFSSWGWSGR